MNTPKSIKHLGMLTVSGLLLSPVLVACDSGDDVDEYGHERASAQPDMLQLAIEDAIAEAMEYEPSPDEFEYTGHIDEPGAAWRRPPRPGPERPVDEPDAEDGSADLIDILTRDGRTYRQIAGTQAIYSSTASRLDPDFPVLDRGRDADEELTASGSLTFRELITGGVDNRLRSTTKNKQGVMVKVAGTSTSTGTTCSASMIGPRVFLTAAHCVTDSNGNWSYGNADWVMPSVRGRSYSGSNTTLDSNDTPWGARQVIRLVKPSAWDGSGAKYDYAILIVSDHAPDGSGSVQWDPAPADFAHESCGSLEGDNVNLRGYPGRTKTCADASSEDGTQCGGYAYTEAKPIDECTSNAIYYYHDSQEGQSGAPVYRYNAGTGVRTVIGINRGTSGSRNYGHKIRSGSYGVMCNQVTKADNLSSYFSNPSC